MKAFQFILSLYSIVAGLGITTLVRGVGQIIEARGRVRPYWVHSCWLLCLFAVNVGSWLSLWNVREHALWTPLDAFLLLLIPIFLYVVSYLAVPDLDESEQLDMRAYYFTHSRWMQGMLFLSLLSGSIATRVIEDRWDMGLGDVLRIVAMLVLLPGIVSDRPRLHAAQMLCLILLLVVALQRVAIPIG
jgi:hypothetical protein